MFATVAELLFLLFLFEEESAFVLVQNNDIHRKRPTLPSERHRYEISNRLHPRRRFGTSSNNVGLFAVPKARNNNNRTPLANPTRERTVVIMYHKPANVITSHSNADKISASTLQGDDGAGRRTVYEDIFSMKGFTPGKRGDANASFEEITGIKSKLHAIGRLDADTTGLLLLTNDGALVHKTTNPNAKDNDGLSANPVQKTYEAVIMGYHSLSESAQQSTPSSQHNTPTTSQSANYTYPLQTLLDEGVALSAKHGGQTKPVDDLKVLSHPSRSTTSVSITISEGKNRQIRRKFHAVGSGVMKLHRVSVGRLSLHGLSQQRSGGSEMSDVIDSELKEGEWRLLTRNEIEEGLGWKCRYLDENHDDAHKKIIGSVNGGRNNQKRRRKTMYRGTKGRT